jgi:hypothetical protein
MPPPAERLRPHAIGDVIGQYHPLGTRRLLDLMFRSGRRQPMILCGRQKNPLFVFKLALLSHARVANFANSKLYLNSEQPNSSLLPPMLALEFFNGIDLKPPVDNDAHVQICVPT